eukprot:2685130-Heterocapsa_arctica.AAC.1
MRDKGVCEHGKACIYSHDTAKIKASKDAAETPKEKKSGDNGDQGGVKGKGKEICRNFLQGKCKQGAACTRLHTQPATSPVPAAPAAAPAGSTPAQLAAGPGQG